MDFLQKKGPGILLCLAIALPCLMLGKQLPVVGGPVFAILAGMVITLVLKDKSRGALPLPPKRYCSMR